MEYEYERKFFVFRGRLFQLLIFISTYSDHDYKYVSVLSTDCLFPKIDTYWGKTFPLKFFDFSVVGGRTSNFLLNWVQRRLHPFFSYLLPSSFS